MKLKKIPVLKVGDTISIVAPAGIVKKDNINEAVEILNQWGLKVLLGDSIYQKSTVYAGSDEERFVDFQAAMDNPEVKAILCARGGYGTVRIIDKLDFTNFIKAPKWVVGFSDITVLHAHLFGQYGIPSVHGVMPNSYGDNPNSVSLISLYKALFTNSYHYSFETHPASRRGEGRGVLIGGNLSILYNLIGTHSDFNGRGKILFIEDIGEYYYHLDRMMQAFKRAGKLKDLKGLLVGHFSEMKEGSLPFEKSIEEIIMDSVGDYNYPVCFGFSAGHVQNNLAIGLGKQTQISVNQEVSRIIS
jgi:muramoyltetrapeptide carboxypeptidase